MRFKKWILATGLIVLGCGIAQAQGRTTGGGGSGTWGRGVSVSPTSASVVTGASQAFTATVRHGQGEGVAWSLVGPGALTNITTTSVTYTATGSSATTATLTATSKANTGKSASLVIKITVPSPSAQVATPTFSPAGGTFSAAQPVILNDATSGASIYYCIAPCTPSTSSTLYGGSISVSASETINAIATKSGDTTSAVGTAAYVISATPPPTTVATPTFSPAGGTFSAAQPVTIKDATSGASIYYCIAPCTPSTSSTLYGGSISVSASETINAIATKSGDTTSAVGTAAYVISATPPPTGTTFYVSPSGNDSNVGSSTAPWLTIQHAANSVGAGNTVYVLAGTYHESVTIAVSGSSTAGPVRFISSPTGGAIVDGTGLTPSTSGTQGLFNIEDESYVTIEGFLIQNYTTSNANATPAGIWITGSGSNIQILNNTVTNITTTSEKNGNAFGIAVYGSEAPAAISYITISGNSVYNCKTGNSETVNVDGNVTNFTITSNTIHDNDNIGIDAIGFEGVAPEAAYDYARNGLIAQNTVYNISAINNAGEGNEYDADGIYCDGCADVVIERNNVSTSDLGIEVASEHSGHVSTGVTVRNNLVYNNNSVGISIGGYASNVGGTSNCYIVNNSLLDNDSKQTGSGEFQVQYYATGNYFENNIVYANSQALFINNYTNSESSPVTSNYNIFYAAGGGANFLWNGKSTSSFSSYQSGSGQDGHSAFSNPDYVSLTLTSPNLQVASGSPALNAGNNLGSSVVGTDDYAGNPRANASSQIDIGAYEQ